MGGEPLKISWNPGGDVEDLDTLVGENIQRLLVRKWIWTYEDIFHRTWELIKWIHERLLNICISHLFGVLGVSELGFCFRICRFWCCHCGSKAGETLKCDMGNANIIGSGPKKMNLKTVHQKKMTKNPRVHFGWWFQMVASLRLRSPKKMIPKLTKTMIFDWVGTPNPKICLCFYIFFLPVIWISQWNSY